MDNQQLRLKGKVQRLSLGIEICNRSRAQAIGVGENPLNRSGGGL